MWSMCRYHRLKLWLCMFSAFLVTGGNTYFIITFLSMVKKRKIYCAREKESNCTSRREINRRANLKGIGCVSYTHVGFPRLTHSQLICWFMGFHKVGSTTCAHARTHASSLVIKVRLRHVPPFFSVPVE